jgi:hypothetical protein
MHTTAISEALHKQPFQPFTIRLADGRAVNVRHPDFVAISPRRVLVINADDESVTWLEPLLIGSIDFNGMPPKQVAETNTGGEP